MRLQANEEEATEMSEATEATDATDISEASDQDTKKVPGLDRMQTVTQLCCLILE